VHDSHCENFTLAALFIEEEEEADEEDLPWQRDDTKRNATLLPLRPELKIVSF
jgi:hypothetical protein